MTGGPLDAAPKGTRPSFRLPERSQRPIVGGDLATLGLAGLASATILVLAALRLAEAPAAVQLAAQGFLVVSFGALTKRDFRFAVTMAMIELATGGAAGRWTVFPGGVSGRIVLDAIIFVWALRLHIVDWRASGSLNLGRYGVHAIVASCVLVLVWIPLGLALGNRPADVIGDGNGYAFIAFVLVFIALLRRGEGAWIRESLFLACAVNALFLFALFLLALSGLFPLFPTIRQALIALDFDGAVGVMPSGAWRLYLPTALYLQVGIVLVAWRLLQAPRAWLWAIYAVMLVDLGLTYTRGFWFGTAAALFVLIALGARSLRPVLRLGFGTMAIFIFASAAGSVVGFSVPDYVLDRASSSLSTRPIPSSAANSPGPVLGGSAPPISTPGLPGPTATPLADELGAVGNQVRLEQARILWGHIVERPIFGSGFGAIAADYPYEQISRYEISYLDLAYKTGLAGAVLFLSVPLRLLWDGFRGIRGQLALAHGVVRRQASVPAAVITSILVVSATNPYLFAAYGLLPILVTVAWLDPLGPDQRGDREIES